MILQSLRLKGFRGLRGLGTSEIFLDLTQLPKDGLVAICGVNGSGKTSLLDNLHPYRIQPFKIRKAKDWSPGAFQAAGGFYRQCYGPDAMKELIFSIGERRFRSLVLIDADRGKQEAYLYEGDGDSWVPLNDGKAGTYDEQIEKVCGSPSLFFTSVFRCQGAKNLSDYKRSDIMAVISELLNIDHIREQSQKCRDVVSGLVTRRDKLSDQIGLLTHEAEAATGLVDEVALLESSVSSDRLALGAARNDLDALRVSIVAKREELALQASEQERKGLVLVQWQDERDRKRNAELAYQQAGRALDGRLLTLKTAHEAKLLNLDTRASRVEDDAATDLSNLAQRRGGLQSAHDTWLLGINERIQRAERIASGAAKIRENVPVETALVSRIAAEKLRLPGLENLRESARRAKSLYDTKMSDISSRLQRARVSATGLDNIDCSKDESGWVKSTCRLIASAVADRDSVVVMEKELAGLEADTFFADALASAEQDLAFCRQTIATDEAALLEAQKFTRLLPELEAAEENLTAWRAEIKTRAEQLASDLAALDVEVAARQTRLEDARQVLAGEREALVAEYNDAVFALSDERVELDAKWQTDAADFDLRVGDLNQQVLAFPPENPNLRTEVSVAEAQERALVASVDDLDKRIREAELSLASLQTRLETAKQKRAEAAALQPKLAKYAELIARFSLLMRACSNDGIISLELDDASPSIAAIVNDLLAACYGRRFTIRMDSQTQKKDGAMKDDFDIIVFDAETGEEASITDKSGGQTTIIEDAITRGICLYNIHRSDRVYGTLYSDERDGALDPERKLEFLKVKREALRVGTHRQEFFISQTSDLVEMADARIILAPGGAVVQVGGGL